MTLLSTDPVCLALDTDGDLPDGDLVLLSGLDAVVMGARVRLQMVRGEWFLDLDRGIPYLERDGVTADQALLGQKFDRAKAIRAFRAELVTVPGVVEIVYLTADFDGATRTISVSWQARTAFGDTPVDTLSVGATP